MIRIDVKVEGVDATVRTLDGVAALSVIETRRAIGRLILQLQKKVVREKLTGQVLKVKHGTLRRSIDVGVADRGSAVEGSVGTNVKYAAIHEFGGRTAAHEIKARKAKALRFQLASGAAQFRKSVMHPGSKMPERSFLRSALREMDGAIREEFEQAIGSVINQAARRG